MGKILDDFMKKHGLDDAYVLAMIGDACLQVVDPEFVYNMDKGIVIDNEIKEEREAMMGGVNAIDRVLLAVNLLQGDPRWKDAIRSMNETVEEVLHYDQSKCN